MARLTIDPVTRIGGHLRIEGELEGGLVSDAWVAATMYRGIEPILTGRDPRDAWLLAQRVCGACSGVHGLASVRAVEDALAIRIPTNARLIRNLLSGAEFVLDHVTHFYQLHSLDWVDPRSALTADPAATSTLARSISDRSGSDAATFRDAQARLDAFVRSGGAAPFIDDEARPMPEASPELSLMVMTHYLEALDWQRELVRFQTLLGGKSPHPQTIVVGGAALAVPWGGPPANQPGQHPSQIDPRAPAALSAEGLALLTSIAAATVAFVERAYLPDVLAIARAYPGWEQVGMGPGHFLAFGEFPIDDADPPALLLPRGRIMDGDLLRTLPVQQLDIGETVAHSHYTDVDGDVAADAMLRHPSDESVAPRYQGPVPPYTTLAGAERYSWAKAARYQGQSMEVGPLARVLVAYVEGRDLVSDRLDEVLSRMGYGPDALFGTLGRMLARAVEAAVLADRLGPWIEDLRANLARGDLAVADLSRWAQSSWPANAAGWSLGEGPRGAVGHWLTIADREIAAYQIVDGSTWNISPRDASGRRGPVEEAIVDAPVADPDRPVEVLRIVHSFDPCAACGVQ
jgi:hydrogenase large subunit